MVDYQSRYRLYSLGYTCPTPREPIPTLLEVKHEANRHLYKSVKDRPVHDCRPEFARELHESRAWEGRVLTRAMRDTYSSVDALHQQQRSTKETRRPDIKLLMQIGQFGTRNGDFKYPRGIATTTSGDIIVADSQNHRVQIFNRMGLFKCKFGTKGNEEGQFDEPVDAAELAAGNIAVADLKNTRVQVFSPNGKFVATILTKDQPYSIACDKFSNCVVATTERSIEIYSYDKNKLINSFKLGRKLSSNCPVQVAVNDRKEIIVSDPVDSCIKCYGYNGRLLSYFQPNAPGERLTVIPGGIYVTALGDVMVADRLNHTVNMYTDKGAFIKQVICPTDEAGSIHSLCLGPEGHLLATEFSVKGPHSLKIFRCLRCECHQVRPPSKRKRMSQPHFMDV